MSQKEHKVLCRSYSTRPIERAERTSALDTRAEAMGVEP